MNTSTNRDLIAHERDQQQRQQRHSAEGRAKRALKAATRAIERGGDDDYANAVELLQRAADALAQLADRPLRTYGRALGDDDRWDATALARCLDTAGALYAYFDGGTSGTPPTASYQANGYDSPTQAACATVEQAHASLTAIAEYGDIVKPDYAKQVDVVGFTTKLGHLWKNPSMDFGDPVEGISTATGSLKHLFTGGTGHGKTGGAGRQFEDYDRSLRNGQPMKNLDPIGLSAENVLYDVPQQDPKLRRARKEHGRPPDFTDLEYTPEAEYLVPLTPGLEDFPLPHKTGSGEAVPEPFTIPASSISRGLLSAVVSADLTDAEQKVIRDAYSTVNRHNDDWCLDDLAAEIKSRGELSDKQKRSAVRTIRSLQNEGFIRTKECEYAIVWDDVFTSTDRITVFNQTPCDSELAQYFIVAYLLDSIWLLRKRAHDHPHLAQWFRELWEVCGHQVQRRTRDEAVTALMKWIINRVAAMLRQPRDINTDIIADSQDPTDLERSIRERFNRYIIFAGLSEDTVEKMFKWAGEKRRGYNQGASKLQNSLNGVPGEAGIVGKVGPAIGDSDKWGVSPVQMVPPSWHQHDKDEGPSGWQKRVELLDGEELRTVGWDWSLPSDLQVTTTVTLNEGGSGASGGGNDPYAHHREMARNLKRQNPEMSIREIIDRLPEHPNADGGEQFSTKTVWGWTNDIGQNSDLEQGIEAD